MNFTLAADADYLVLSTPFLFVCRFILLIYLTLYGDDHTHTHSQVALLYQEELIDSSHKRVVYGARNVVSSFS